MAYLPLMDNNYYVVFVVERQTTKYLPTEELLHNISDMVYTTTTHALAKNWLFKNMYSPHYPLYATLYSWLLRDNLSSRSGRPAQ